MQRVLVVLCLFEPMSAGTFPVSPHGSALNDDSSSEDMRFLEACDAFARNQVAGSLQGSGLEVVGSFRDETTAHARFKKKRNRRSHNACPGLDSS